eukprot:jgi/Bigna1/81418/fgenesh1_pg.80_\
MATDKSSSSDAMFRKVPSVDFLYALMPRSAVIGRYGGGDDIHLVTDADSGLCFHKTILDNFKLPQSLEKSITASLPEALEHRRSLTELYGVADTTAGGERKGESAMMKSISWSATLNISHPPPPPQHKGDGTTEGCWCNLVLTGWLYPKGLKSGICGMLKSTFPLCGLYNTKNIGIKSKNAKGSDGAIVPEPDMIGMQALRPAHQ